MKILWFSPANFTTNLKGGGGWVNSLAKNLLLEDDIDLHIAFKSNVKKLFFKNDGNLTTWYVPSEKYTKYKVILSNFFNFFNDKKVEDIYLDIVNKIKPDIIQIFGSENDFATVLFKTKIPVLIHIQAVYQVYHHKYFSGISIKDTQKYSSLKSKLLRRTFKHIYNRRSKDQRREALYFKNCDYFLGRTGWDKRCTKVLAPNAKYFHCDEMMREEFFIPKWRKKYNAENITIVSIIGGAIYKGLETIIETIDLLMNIHNCNINWKVIGLSEKNDSVKICKRKYKDKFNSKINLLGKLGPQEIIDIMLESDMYVHPSHIENSPNSVCEAMLVGMPIIATFTGGTSSLLKDNESGMLIQDGDPWSMAGAIIELYNDNEKAEKIGSNAKSIAKKRHDPKKIISDILTIYRSITLND